MSPEQARGEEVDARSDIFSLGVVLYEMLTGEPPFKGAHEAALLYEIVHEEPEPVTALRSGIPMELDRIVNKALAKRPDERYQHADEILVDLRRLKKELEAPSRIQPSKLTDRELKKRRFKKVFIPTAVVIVAALAFLVLRPLLFEEVLVSAPKPIAVINFENKTGDSAYDNLRDVIPDLLITNLEQSRYLRVTTMERMHDLLKQMGKEDVEIIDKDLGFELCRMDGIDAIVLGSFAKAGDVFVTDVKVLDVETKELLKSASSKGKGVGSILERQIDELSREISRGVGLSERKIEETSVTIAEVTTTSIDAYNYFLRGREEFSKYYYNNALQFLEKAITLDSTFASAYLYLGLTYRSSGDYNAMIEAIKKAKALSERATDKERLFIDAIYAYYIERDDERSFLVLKQMAKKYPREKRVHYWLAVSYYSPRRMFDKAIEVLTKALELDPNYSEVINILGYTYADMGDFEKAIEYLKRYASVSPGDANPFDSMGEIYLQMGRLDEAIAKFREALEVEPNFGSDWKIAYIYALKEDYDGAMEWVDRYITMAPSPGFRVYAYMWKGFYRYWLGSLDRSLRDLQRAEELAKEIEDNPWLAFVDLIKGWIYYESGELELGRMYFKSYYDFSMEYNPHYGPYYTAEYNFYLGLVDLKKGRVGSARSRLKEMEPPLPDIIASRYKAEIAFSYDLLQAEVLLAEGSAGEAIAVSSRAVGNT